MGDVKQKDDPNAEWLRQAGWLELLPNKWIPTFDNWPRSLLANWESRDVQGVRINDGVTAVQALGWQTALLAARELEQQETWLTEAIEADAKRYRYIRDELAQAMSPHMDGTFHYHIRPIYKRAKSFDEAVDQAMSDYEPPFNDGEILHKQRKDEP